MRMSRSEAARSAIWDSWKTGGASTANEIRWKSKAWAAPNFNARARKNLFYLSFLNVREARPPSSGRPGRARARARARALSTNQNFKITTFLLVNFKNDHGKSCSVSRDWQPPKISAQCVPISQSNDQKPISFNFKERISAQFSHHFLIFFADIPLPRPPSLSAVPYGANNFNLKLESRWNSNDFKNVFEFRLQICRSQDPPVFKLSHMAMIVAIWDSLKTGGASTANEIR